MGTTEKSANEKKIILVVNGYGCHLDSPLGKTYLPKVIRYIRHNYRNILLIVFTGGCTQNSSAPGCSEAELMRDHVFERLNWWLSPELTMLEIAGYRPEVEAETEAYTSFDNSRLSARIIRDFLHKELNTWDIAGRKIDLGGCIRVETISPKLRFGDVRIVHFCEATRAANVIMLDRHFMAGMVAEPLDDITVETASWERADPFKQACNLIYNKLAIKFPWLKLAERESKRRRKSAETK